MRKPLLLVTAVLAASLALGSEAYADHDRTDGGRERADTRSFRLSGSQVPGGGDPHGRAGATLRLFPDDGVVCFRTNWHDLTGEVTAIHIHHAPRRRAGGSPCRLASDPCILLGGSSWARC
jgi:hypothetical protein